jgi:HK97 family phage prohead protease
MKEEIFKPEKRVFDVNVAIEKRADDTKSRKVIIRAAVTNSLSKPLGWGFKERIEQGAFDGADMSDVVAVLNHDFNILYARTASKTLSLKVDENGLEAEFEAPNTSHGDDLLEMITRGDINQASFQFILDKDRWVNDPDEGEVRIIEKFRKIIDVSPVVFPAYSDTDVAKRSHDEFKQTEESEKKIPPSVMHAEAELELIKVKRFNN